MSTPVCRWLSGICERPFQWRNYGHTETCSLHQLDKWLDICQQTTSESVKSHKWCSLVQVSRLATSTLVTFPCCQQLSKLLSLHVTLASFSMQSWQCLLMSLHTVDPDSFNSDSYAHSPGHSLRKLLNTGPGIYTVIHKIWTPLYFCNNFFKCWSIWMKITSLYLLGNLLSGDVVCNCIFHKYSLYGVM